MKKKLRVMLDEQQVGVLLVEKNSYEFQYSTSWLNNSNAFPLSVSLPLDSKPFNGRKVQAYFSNLLPEGDIRSVIEQHYRISKGNDFELLVAIGGECAGAISFVSKDHLDKFVDEYEPLSSDRLFELINNMSEQPLIISPKEVRLSLAGAQNKLPIYIEDDQFFVPHGHLPSSHILKPPNPRFHELVENEYFCMVLAKKLGLIVPEVYIHVNKIPVFLIERYDRVQQNGRLIRLHQEDFCQALGIPPTQKYQSEGGPTLVDCFGLIKQFSSTPAPDTLQLMKWVYFNYLIGNADAHGKNLSFIHTPSGARLAPFYDLLSTEVYRNLSRKLAMKIEKIKEYRFVAKRHWDRLANAVDSNPNFF